MAAESPARLGEGPELCEVSGGMLCLCWGGEAHGLMHDTPVGVELHLKAIFLFSWDFVLLPSAVEQGWRDWGHAFDVCACICSSAEVRAEECCCNYGCRQGLSIMGIRVWLSQRFPVWSWSSHLITFASFLSCTVYILRLQLPALSI